MNNKFVLSGADTSMGEENGNWLQSGIGARVVTVMIRHLKGDTEMTKQNQRGQALVIIALSGLGLLLLLMLLFPGMFKRETVAVELSGGTSLGEAARAAQVAYAEQAYGIDVPQHKIGKLLVFYVLPNFSLNCPNDGEVGFTIRFPFFWSGPDWRPGQSMSGHEFDYNFCAKPGSIPRWNVIKLYFAKELAEYVAKNGIDIKWAGQFIEALKEYAMYFGKLPGGG